MNFLHGELGDNTFIQADEILDCHGNQDDFSSYKDLVSNISRDTAGILNCCKNSSSGLNFLHGELGDNTFRQADEILDCHGNRDYFSSYKDLVSNISGDADAGILKCCENSCPDLNFLHGELDVNTSGHDDEILNCCRDSN